MEVVVVEERGRETYAVFAFSLGEEVAYFGSDGETMDVIER